ncbi:DUF4936 family protein [Leptothrix discophora]|uniref:DUF4936 family protein n=1 Tax=Leptothrix discophora TaxID=89 RepID=A0ABT9FZA1_LEPDI|nr:DUF4936 family protein [Leptothrix discophora]MDP4299564.1 DUF4936 family protein [Leptothrix discophora]
MCVPGLELYVYYGVDRHRIADARRAIVAAQADLRRDWPGLETRLLSRSDESAARTGGGGGGDGGGKPVTWMETYRHPAGLDAALLDALRMRLADLPPGRHADRHEERFVAFDAEG